MLKKLFAYLTDGEELNIILFKILGAGGIGISAVSGIYSLIINDYPSAVIDLSAGVLAFLLLHFVEKTGHYIVGYITVELAVFMFLFSILFFQGGGLDGSLPYFFSFALIFTFLMFEGKMLILMESLLAVFYMVIFVVSIRYPDLVYTPGNEMKMLRERIVGTFIPAFFMGFIFLLYIWELKKQKQIAEDANRSKSMFLANMSHELRTPINTVLGFNEIIKRTSDDNTAKEYSGYIEQSGRHLLDVINEILDFSRIDSGKSELTLDAVNLHELAHEMQSVATVLIGRADLKFILDYDENLTEIVLSDRKKLVKILTNLLSNAFKYTKEGTVTLHIRLKEMKPEGQLVYFAVEDTGIGIRMSDINNLFHAYERADLTKNQEVEGTGLGLPITEQLLHLFGSSVHIESTYGKGSTFSFELILPPAISEQTETLQGDDILSFTAPEASVLVVDDDDMNLKMMDTFLNMFRITADFAINGEECLERTGKSDYHLILMDYMMPGPDGAETMEKIRETEKLTGKHTPIIVLTADIIGDIDRTLISRGFDDYLSKPVNLTTLEKSLRKYLPDHLIVSSFSTPAASVSRKQTEVCAKLLAGYGIILEDGLRLVNDDFLQYLRIAVFFVNQSETDMENVKSAAAAKDLSALRLYFHALKGKAGNIGAKELRTIAAKLEDKCSISDTEFVLCGTDLAILQWSRCVKGLTQLLNSENQTEPHPKTGLEEYPYEDILEELKKYLKLNEGRKAREAAQQLKNTEEGKSRIQTLDEIIQLIEDMEFESALEKTGECK